MASIDGIKNSCQEMEVTEHISSHARQRGIPLREVLLNKNKVALDEFLVLPVTFDVRGKGFEDYARARLEKYLPFINAMDYLKDPIVHSDKFSFDIVVTYHRKDPVFFELNDFYHYRAVSGKTSYETIVRKIACDYAKKVLVESAGYKFVEIPTIDKRVDEYIGEVLKEI